MHTAAKLSASRQFPCTCAPRSGACMRASPFKLRTVACSSAALDELVAAATVVLNEESAFKQAFHSSRLPPKAATVVRMRQRLMDVRDELRESVAARGSTNCAVDVARIKCLAVNAQLVSQLEVLERHLTTAAQEPRLPERPGDNLPEKHALPDMAERRALAAERAALRGEILHSIEYLRKLDRATRAAGSALLLPSLQQQQQQQKQQAPAAPDAPRKKAVPGPASHPHSRLAPFGGLDTPFTPISKALDEATAAAAAGTAQARAPWGTRVPDMLPVQTSVAADGGTAVGARLETGEVPGDPQDPGLASDGSSDAPLVVAPTCDVRPPHLPPVGGEPEAEAEAWDPVVAQSGNLSRSHWPPAARARAAAEALARTGTPRQQAADAVPQTAPEGRPRGPPGAAATAARGGDGTPALGRGGGSAAAAHSADPVPSRYSGPVAVVSVPAPRASVPPTGATPTASLPGPSPSPLSAASSEVARPPAVLSAAASNAVPCPNAVPGPFVARDAFHRGGAPPMSRAPLPEATREANSGPVSPAVRGAAPRSHVHAASAVRGS